MLKMHAVTWPLYPLVRCDAKGAPAASSLSGIEINRPMRTQAHVARQPRTIAVRIATRINLMLENLALRQQLVVLRRQVARVKLKPRDRVFWALLSRLWSGWRECLVLVQPATVIGWQRAGFRLFWRLKSRGTAGRPRASPEVQRLIREMSTANRLWGAPRIQAELAKLGVEVALSTVQRYMVRRPPKRPEAGPSWRVFLRNDVRRTVAVDFMTVATVNFKVLYVFVVLSLSRRRILHVNVTRHPTGEWTARQIVEAFPWGDVPNYLQRDRDGIYCEAFKRQVNAMGIEELISAPRSPWQNGYVERVIGTIRRECLDHMVVLGENHLREVLKEYVEYHNTSRTHLSLEGDCQEHREPQTEGRVYAVPWLGGLHHTYRRNAG